MILIFGKTGQVGHELSKLGGDTVFLTRDEADLADPESCAEAILSRRPTAVINAAAYTAVDAAETDEAQANRVNGLTPAAMARACARAGAAFVHISTDYVFDGSGIAPFNTKSPTAPLNAYGRSKLLGEQGIVKSGATYAILRTSWVFSSHGQNFVKSMLRLSQNRTELRIVADQVGGPTPAAALASACLKIAEVLPAEPQKSGIYHCSGAPATSWAGFARAIFSTAGRATTVVDIPTSDYPTPAARPLNSRMDCSGLAAFGLAQPDWREALERVIHELEPS